MAYQRKIPTPSPSKQTQAPAPKTKNAAPMKAASLPSMKQGFTNKAQSKKK